MLARCLVALAAAALAPAGSGAQERQLLTGATLIDGTGAPPLRGARIVVAGEHIECVSGPGGCPVAASVAEVDLGGLWVTPGLIDTHVHLRLSQRPEQVARDQALRFALGITTTRDASTLDFEALLAERVRATDASSPVPRLVASVRPGPPYEEMYGIPRSVELVERLVAMGADAIKIKGPFSDTLWLAETRAGRGLGLPVYGHTWDGPPMVDVTPEAVAAGFTGVSHLTAFPIGTQPAGTDVSWGVLDDEAAFWNWQKGLWSSAEDSALDNRITAMIEHDVWLEPMLVTEVYWFEGVRPPPFLGFLRSTPPGLRDLLTLHDVLEDSVPPAFPEAYARMVDFVRRFHERGGTVVAGGDEASAGLGLHEEIELLRRAGLPPEAALAAATSAAAAALDRSDIGTVEAGKLADLTIYAADPLGELGGTLHVTRVMKGGRMYSSAELLQPFRDRYAERVAQIWRDRMRRLGPLGLVGLAGLLGAALLWRARRARRSGRRTP